MTDGVAAYGQAIPVGVPKGGVGIVLQSGALTTVMLKFSIAHAIGLSKVVCLGNEAIVRAADVLEHLIADPETRVIAMFLEQIREGSRFRALAERALLCGKAIVAVKAGRTPAGQKAALADMVQSLATKPLLMRRCARPGSCGSAAWRSC